MPSQRMVAEKMWCSLGVWWNWALQEHTVALPTFDFVPWSGGEQRSVHDAAVGRPLVWASEGSVVHDETVVAAAAQRISAAALNLNGMQTFRTYGLGGGDDFAYSTGSEEDSDMTDDELALAAL